MGQQPRPTTASIDAATDRELDEAVKLAHEWGQLKMLPRTGWLRAGIEHPESVAEHSLRAAMLAWMLAGLEGADPERAATLALFYDSQETRTTDLDHVARRYLHATSNEQVTADQTAALPGHSRHGCVGWSRSTRGVPRWRPTAPATPTSWRCCCRRSTTERRATATRSRSWRPRWRRCAPHRGAGWARPR